VDRVADKSGAPSGFAECGREALPLHETGEVSAPISDACKNGGEAGAVARGTENPDREFRRGGVIAGCACGNKDPAGDTGPLIHRLVNGIDDEVQVAGTYREGFEIRGAIFNQR
jgi:hypothetical protein